MDIQPYLDEIQKLAPLDIKAFVIEENWINSNFFSASTSEAIALLISEYPNGISRNDVINYMADPKSSLLNGFVLTMIWGHGGSKYNKSDNRGPWKVGQMLENIDKVEIMISKAQSYLMANNISEAFDVFSSMKRCGISFLSKFLYFQGRALSMERYPLIFDARVASGISQLTSSSLDFLSILNVSPKQDAQSYSKYVAKIHNLANRFEIEAEKIEFFLFSRG